MTSSDSGRCSWLSSAFATFSSTAFLSCCKGVSVWWSRFRVILTTSGHRPPGPGKMMIKTLQNCLNIGWLAWTVATFNLYPFCNSYPQPPHTAPTCVTTLAISSPSATAFGMHSSSPTITTTIHLSKGATTLPDLGTHCLTVYTSGLSWGSEACLGKNTYISIHIIIKIHNLIILDRLAGVVASWVNHQEA